MTMPISSNVPHGVATPVTTSAARGPSSLAGTAASPEHTPDSIGQKRGPVSEWMHNWAGPMGGLATFAVIAPAVLVGTVSSVKSYFTSQKSYKLALANSKQLDEHMDETRTGQATHERVQTPRLNAPLHENLINQWAATHPAPAGAGLHESGSAQGNGN